MEWVIIGILILMILDGIVFDVNLSRKIKEIQDTLNTIQKALTEKMES